MEQFKSKIVVLCTFCQSIFKVATELEGKSVTCAKCNKPFIAEAGSTTMKKGDGLENSLLFCKIALNYGFINEHQLAQVLSDYTSLARAGVVEKIERLFLRSGFLDERSAAKILDIMPKWWIRQKEKQFAADAVEKGLISKEQAKEILIEQAKLYNKTGQIKWVSDFLEELGGNGKVQKVNSQKELVAETAASTQSQVYTKAEPEVSEVNSPETGDAVERDTETRLSPESGDKYPVSEQAGIDSEVTPEPEKTTTPLQKTVESNMQTESAAPEPAVEPVATENEPDSAETKEMPEEIEEAVLENEHSITEKTAHKAEAEEVPFEERGIEDDEERKVKTINGLELTVSSDKVVALLKAPSGILPGTTVERIKHILSEEGICYGVADDALIKGFINSKKFREKPFKIAEGKPLKPGKEGGVEYYFETNPLTVGAVSETGEIDFRDRGEIPYVKEGDLLAEITPAVRGENGMDIYGNIIEVPTIHPIMLRGEEGTRTSEDGSKIYAETDGQPKLAIGDRLSVLSELIIPGDIGFETGHVEFEGNIVVRGTIQSDFKVKGANITANEILSANVTATGDLTVKNGITGAKVAVEGNVKAKFINKSAIKAFGNILVEKELIDSTIKTSGGCQVQRGKIIASDISSRQGIEAVEIGTEMSTPSKLRIGVDDHIEDEVSVIEKEIEACKAFIEEVKGKIATATEEEKNTHSTIAELAQVQDRAQIEVNELKIKIEELKKEADDEAVSSALKKIEELNTAIKNADDEVNKQFDSQDALIEMIAKQNDLLSEAVEKLGVLKHDKNSLRNWANSQKTVSYIKTSGPLYAGTTIIGVYTSMVVKETVRKVKIREVQNPDMPEGWEMRFV